MREASTRRLMITSILYIYLYLGVSEQAISDVVVTVPPYFNQAERRAVAHAVDLSGLSLLQLMSDNSAGK